MGVRHRIDLAKAATVLLVLCFSFEWYVRRVSEITTKSSLLLYLCLWCLCTVATLSAAFIPNGLLRILVGAAMVASMTISESYRAVMSEFLSYEGFQVLFDSRSFVVEAVQQYTAPIAKAGLLSLGLMLGIAIQPRSGIPRGRLARAGLSVFPLVVAVALTSAVYFRGGRGTKGLPSSYAAVPYIPIALLQLDKEDYGPREPVSIPFRPERSNRDIVLIVDESIRADFLGWNSSHGVQCDLPGADRAVHNFGLAASATNCSTGSNVILRYGGRRETYRQHFLTKPSIWRYAKNAGFATIYFDGQKTGGRLQNMHDRAELDDIDEYVQFDEAEVIDRDMLIAKRLAELSRNNRAEFILANKVGAHFPVHDKFPDDYMHFQPVLPRGLFGHVSDTGERSGFGDMDWPRFLNSYRNTLLWNVCHFFEILLENVDLEEMFIIYTSDHGQNFHEDGNAGMNLHCSYSPSPDEGMVPMMIISEDAELSPRAAEWSMKNTNRSSHFNIFSTLLVVMGYDEEEVRREHGPYLLEPTDDPMTFNSNWKARLVQKPRWNKIDLSGYAPPLQGP